MLQHRNDSVNKLITYFNRNNCKTSCVAKEMAVFHVNE